MTVTKLQQPAHIPITYLGAAEIVKMIQVKIAEDKSLIAFCIRLAIEEKHPANDIIKSVSQMISNNRLMMEGVIGHFLVCKVLNLNRIK